MLPFLKKKPGRERVNDSGDVEWYWSITYRMPDMERHTVAVGWHTEDSAREERADARAAFRRGEDPFPDTVTTDEGLVLYLKWLGKSRPETGTPRNRLSTIEDKDQVLGFFFAWLKVTFPMVETVAEIRLVHLDAFVEWRRETASSATITKNQAYIGHFMAYALRQKWTHVKIERWERLPRQRKAKRYYQEEAQIAILDSIEPELSMAWLFVLSTGCRPGEMFDLCLRDLRPWERVALFDVTKNNDPRPVVYSKELARYFGEMLAAVAVGAFLRGERASWDGPVFLHPATHKKLNRWTWRRAVYRAQDAGDVERTKPYASRHTFVTERLNLGVPKHQIRDATGQRTTAVIDEYSLTTAVTVKGAFDAVDADRLLGSNRGPMGETNVVSIEDRKKKSG